MKYKILLLVLFFQYCHTCVCQSFSSDMFCGKWWCLTEEMTGDTTTYYYSNSQCIYINHIRARNAFYVGIKPYYLSDAILSSFDLTKCGHVTNGKFMYKPKLYFELKSASNDIVVLKPKRYTSERVTDFISDDICLKTLSNKPRFDDLYYFTDYDISLSKQNYPNGSLYDKILSLSLSQRLISNYTDAQQLSLYNSLCSGYKKYKGTQTVNSVTVDDVKNYMSKLSLKYSVISLDKVGESIKSGDLVLCTVPNKNKTYVVIGEITRYPDRETSKVKYVSIDPVACEFVILDDKELVESSLISYSGRNRLNANGVNDQSEASEDYEDECSESTLSSFFF